MMAKPLPALLPTPAEPTDGLVARLRRRMFEPAAPRADKPKPPAAAKREIGFQASLAEFLLINRLRARRKAAPSADVLEQGARIVHVTCKHWFSAAKPPSGTPRTRL